jgi:UDP-N-acetyl-D-galactosamine dehydrogenase
LEAAGTKWNFLPFRSGLVGGHCIGVDPYYLAQKAQEYGYHPEIILAGRRMNDSMGEYIANEVIKLMLKKKIQVVDSKALILGFTFKENCPDVRNTKVIDIVKALKTYRVNVTIYDPWANPVEVEYEYGVVLTKAKPEEKFETVVLAVAHKEFNMLNLSTFTNPDSVIYDVKGFWDGEIVDGRL